jgi:hypothetical protein
MERRGEERRGLFVLSGGRTGQNMRLDELETRRVWIQISIEYSLMFHDGEPNGWMDG